MKKRAHRVAVTQIEVMNLNSIRHRRDVLALDPRIVKVVKIVENGNAMTERDQLLNQMRTDEAGSACH